MTRTSWLQTSALILICLGLFVCPVTAQAGIYSVFPRLGLIQADWQPGSLLVLADSDEGLLVSEIPDHGFSDFGVFANGFMEPVAPGATLIAGDLDAGDYAFAVGILRPEATSNPIGYELDAFFQLRLAGSTATALTGVAGTPDPGTDPLVPLDLIDDRIISTFGSLAGMAVAQGKWSNADDYIEFEPQFALASFDGPAVAGPGAWSQSVFPEPTSAVMALLAATICVSPRRR